MAPSFMKKTMVYLGLLDDEYDEYDDLEDRAPRGFSGATRVEPRQAEYEQPEEFSDAKEIADRLKDNRPVIVNLQNADRDLQRRMIDFCSGVTYALSGEMEKVADQVFLLAPTNVKVSDEERQRLVERDFRRD